MSSILKILVDIQCLVYCDFEQVGEAFPNSIFKMELRKGTYIIEFKIDGIVLVSKEYIMKSDNEEDLLRINLSIALSKYKREQECLKIANINADARCRKFKIFIFLFYFEYFFQLVILVLYVFEVNYLFVLLVQLIPEFIVFSLISVCIGKLVKRVLDPLRNSVGNCYERFCYGSNQDRKSVV